ncbi:MAG: YqaJ viral recombinase family protein [Oscillospiraceae bacterium]|nr:YqaJ viral recombinase family protein [Oscillospiraceae bacterium]
MIREIAYKDRSEWLAMRRGYIGGSDAGAVMGLDDYKSPYSLWAEKTGRVPEFEGNVATRVGSYLEELVARIFCEETGKQVRRKNRMLVNDAYPFACADLDRVVVGEKALLECKTTNSFPVMRRVGKNEYPERWYCQMVHYLAVTGLERAYLAVLVGCRDFHTFTLERDEAEIAALMDAEARFWRLVTEDTPPAPDGSDATETAIETVYRDSRDDTVTLYGRRPILDERAALTARKRELEDRIREIDNIIKADLGEAETGETDGWRVTWKPQTRSSFQRDAFEADHPDIDPDGYYKQTTTRTYKIKEFKEDK